MLYRRSIRASLLAAIAALSLPACKETTTAPADAGVVVTSAPDAGAPAVDLSRCLGCQLTAQQSWTFVGAYRDDACTDPLVQQAPPACAPIPELGSASVTYVDEVGGRKAGEVATVTLTEQIAATAPRYRKSGTKCVRADESAVALTPTGCAGGKICRDPAGGLTCGACRTLSGGCPDYQETRMYAAVNDPALKKSASSGGDGNLARLRQCCTALAAQAKQLGSSPEAGLINSAAAQCHTLVTAAGPSGTAPELGALRMLLAGRNVPAVCAGF